ncbi:hypothetical protein V8E53_011688 [Lactarius tabidus]
MQISSRNYTRKSPGRSQQRREENEGAEEGLRHRDCVWHMGSYDSCRRGNCSLRKENNVSRVEEVTINDKWIQQKQATLKVCKVYRIGRSVKCGGGGDDESGDDIDFKFMPTVPRTVAKSSLKGNQKVVIVASATRRQALPTPTPTPTPKLLRDKSGSRQPENDEKRDSSSDVEMENDFRRY